MRLAPQADMIKNVENGQFWLAMIVGVVVLWIHARSQFDKLSLEHSGGYQRLISKIGSSDLHASAEYRRAFVIYAAILTVIYVVLCIYIAVPDLQLMVRELAGRDVMDLLSVGASKLPETVAAPVAGVAFDEKGGLLGTIDAGEGLNASVPLAISLAVVGLAPNVPWLARVEEFIRATAHRLAGIPTRLVNGSLALSDEPFLAPDETGGQLLSPDDWARVERYRERLDSDFADDVVTIVALRGWIMQDGDLSPRGRVPTGFASIERDVTDRIEKLLRDLETALSKSSGSRAVGQDDSVVDWQGLRREARETREDACLILGLYGSQRLYSSWLCRLATATSDRKSGVARKLWQAVDRVELSQSDESVGTVVFFRLSVVVLAVSVLAAVFSGDNRLDAGPRSQVSLILNYVTTALLIYVFPLCFALHYQQQMVNLRRWHDWEHGKIKYSQWIPQYIFVFSIAFLIGFVGFISFDLFSVLVRVGFDQVRANFAEIVDVAIRQDAFDALKGAALALAVVAMIDVWRAKALDGRWKRLVLIQTVVVGLLAAAARGYASWAGTGEIAFGKLVQAGLPAMAIGAICGIYVAYTLWEDFSS